ncbi:lytic transglycosylase domain-containing protein [Hydrogenophaga sp. PAMC20947]|uniref:lytic transglycosylase domain-containing protein n=1 Tax=Hydrogenophaga sp. PAMC20947 TaxID=2565558 RepID=UPI00109DF8D2|nr:lytic transglycosylase domain-containing protein [Hydrogenophaga sp. PAMC20947]QCB45043.1 lytic transglycosylase domain-containing protein [Hydrogenophaga sp. PAMC20947]
MTQTSQTDSGQKRHKVAPLKTITQDAYRGFIDLTHNGLALVGLGLVVGALTLTTRGDWRENIEQQALTWLQERHEPAIDSAAAFSPDPDAIDRVTALHTSTLPKQQANVAYWLSRKYRVAPEPLGVLVAEAFEVGEKARIDPTLILAVMAIESRFNPFAQSPVGAQGLMQVLTRVHTDKYDDFGGQLAAFDPVTNLRVGAQVLRECIQRAGGSVEGGLKLYVGAVTTDGSGYINKVIAEHLRIQSVALGKPMPRSFPVYRPIPVVAPAETEASTAAASGIVPVLDAEALVKPQAPTADTAPLRS